MNRFIYVMLTVVLVAAVALGAADRRKEKLAEERSTTQVTNAPPSVQSTNDGWLKLWSLAPSGFDFRSVHYSPNGVVWVAGFDNTSLLDYVWYSTNHGSSWTKNASPSGDAGITEIAVLNDSTGVVGTFDGYVYRTTDRGATWDSVYYYGAGAGWFDGMRVINGDTLIAFGDADASGLLVIRSFDGGLTWTRSTNLPAEEATPSKWASYSTYRRAMDVYGRTVWITVYTGSGTYPRIMRSLDAGETWTSWEVPLTGGATNQYYIRSFMMVDDSLGYIVSRRAVSGQDNWLHRTTNGGVTFSDTLNFEAGIPHNDQRPRTVFQVPGTDSLIALGFGGAGATAKSLVYWSGDLGQTWTAQHPQQATTELTGAGFISAKQGIIVGFTTAFSFTQNNLYKVVFTANTATVPDTIPVKNASIQIRGGVNHAGGYSPITWGNDAQNNLTRVGGDYWTKTLYMQEGDTLRYKYVIAYGTGTGWEAGVVPADFPASSGADRSLIVPSKDTTLSVEFWNNGAGDRPQYFRPWTAAEDSFMNVYFRVNMLGPMSSGTFSFNNNTDTVGLSGGGGGGADLDWGRTFFLTRESAASNGDGYTVNPQSFWSGRVRIPKSGVTEGQTMYYKFVIGSDTWSRNEFPGAGGDRTWTVPIGKKDTTLYWGFYNNERPGTRANPDTIRFTFIANLAQAAATGGFNVLTDTVMLRTGYFQTAAEAGRGKMMQRVSGTIFQVTDTIITAKNKLLDYQYYAVRNAQEVRENYYNFYFTGPVQSEAERRQILVDSLGSLTTTQTVRDTATSITQARRQPVFPNARKLARNVNVTWKVDLRPAIYQVWWGGDSLQDIQGTFTVRQTDRDSILKWGLWINGPAVGGWSNPSGDWGVGLNSVVEKKLWDDGTNGDATAADSIFTRKTWYSPDSVNIGSKDRVGQTFKFGIRGGDNEGGRGGFGNNHNENIVDTDSIYTMDTQFGSINPAFYDAWNYDLRKPQVPTSVFEPGKPLVYELAQNYPNPFNPTTKIEYAIPAQAKVELRVYNLVGQEVATLVNDVQSAGVHFVKFNATNLASGVYFYRLVAGDFVSVKKMVLLK